jgi:hypothetical protein
VQAVLIYPFYQSGQVSGFLGGLKGAAEYETLTGRPGAGVRGMGSQSAGHLLIVLCVIVGNIASLGGRRRPGAPAGGARASGSSAGGSAGGPSGGGPSAPGKDREGGGER